LSDRCDVRCPDLVNLAPGAGGDNLPRHWARSTPLFRKCLSLHSPASVVGVTGVGGVSAAGLLRARCSFQCLVGSCVGAPLYIWY
jgi:hypothetical protein